MSLNRRRFLMGMAIASGSSLGLGALDNFLGDRAWGLEQIVPIGRQPTDTIAVGLLHSLSGSMAIAEKSVVDAELLAIAEINRAGGVLGRQVVPRLEDGASDWTIFRDKMQQLVQANVVTIFGCWTSASRKSVLPTLEEAGHLLWYPISYEGQECSQDILYTGLLPNQMIEPVVAWLLKTYPNRPFFLVGSDYVFPRTVNEVIRTLLKTQGVAIAGEVYIPLGNVEEVIPVVRQIRQLPQGAIIFNTLNGDSNIPLYQAMRSLDRQRFPVISPSISEEEVLAIGPELMQNSLAIASYFQTVKSPASRQFVAAFKHQYGETRVVNDAMASAYTAVYLWKLAVEKAKTATDLNRVIAAARTLSWQAPTGLVTLTPNHHLAQPVRVGKVRRDGLFEIVFESAGAIAPQPWNQQIVFTQGYACDWSDPARGGKYRVSSSDRGSGVSVPHWN